MEKRDESRSRSRSRDRRSNHDNDEGHNSARVARDERNESRPQTSGIDGGNNLYITNLSFQTTEESLRAFFEVLGDVSNASVVREPQTQSSRGFGFVSFVEYAHSERAVLELNGRELDSRIIRVEKARRASGYDKTPGRYLGPPQVSAKFGSAALGGRDMHRGGDRMGYGGDRMGGDRMGGDRMGGLDRMGGGDRYPSSYDRGYAPRDDRGYGGGYDRPAPMYKEERREREMVREASREPLRYDPRRGRSPPPAMYHDDRRGGEARYEERRDLPPVSRGRDEYVPRSYSRPRDDVRSRGAPVAMERAPYGSYGGSYDARVPSGGYEARGGSYDTRGASPPRGRY